MPESDVPTFEAPPKPPDARPGQLIVRVRPGAGAVPLPTPTVALTRAEAKLVPDTVAKPLDDLRANAGLTQVEPLFSARSDEVEQAAPNPRRAAPPRGALERRRLANRGAGRLRGPLPPAAMHYALVEPMPARWLQAAAADPIRNLQWGLRAIKWFDGKLPDASGVVVGILDTGVDRFHPDLRGVVAAYDAGADREEDLLGHGTHVAGMIAAAANNTAGIAGVAHCKLVAWKIFPDTPAQDGHFYVDGVRYLRVLQALEGTGVRVVNLSIGGGAYSLTEELLFRRLEEANITVVAAMGNEYLRGNPTSYPAAYSSVFSVGSVAETLLRSPFSNAGRHIDLVAPGSNILSTVPTKASA